MPLGRIDIFKPDGPVENFTIEKDVTAVGRLRGNDLVLDRNGISRYHITLTMKESQAIIVDLESVNGTYVDGERLPPNEPRVLRGGEEIIIGDVRLVFHPASDYPLFEATQTQQFKLPRVQYKLEGPYIAVAPGAHAQAFLTIDNIYTEQETFFIRVENISKDWVRIDRSEVDVNAESDTRVTFTFKPLRRPDSKPGDYTPIIKIHTRSDPNNITEIKAALVVLGYSGYGAVMGTPVIEGDQPFQLFIHNQGNIPLPLSFTGVSKTKNLTFEFPSAHLTLNPGERRTLTGYVRLKRKSFFGKVQEFNYDILTHSHDASRFVAPVSGKYRVKPLLPTWALGVSVVGMLLVVILIVLLAIILSGGSDDNEPHQAANQTQSNTLATQTAGDAAEQVPVIWKFEVRPDDTVSLDTPFNIEWQVEHADTVVLSFYEGEGKLVEQPLPALSGVDYPVLIRSAGNYTLLMTATRQDNFSTISRTVAVTPLLVLSPALPNEQIHLYRNLEQTVTLNWNIIWTRESGIASTPPPSDLTLVISDAGNPSSTYFQQQFFSDASTAFPESMTINILPTSLNEVVIQLTRTGKDKLTVKNQAVLTVAYPTCRLRQTRPVVLLPSGNQIQGDVLGGVDSVQVDGRSDDGAWVLVLLPPQGTVLGWIQAIDLNCDFEIPRLAVSPQPSPPAPVGGGSSSASTTDSR